MQSRYSVFGCPFRFLDGDYTLNTQADTATFTHISGKYSLFSPGPRMGWIIADEKSLFCKNVTDSTAPLRVGWSYWNSRSAKYVACSNMTVQAVSNPSPVRPTTADKPPKSPKQSAASPFQSTNPVLPETAPSGTTTNPPPVPLSRAPSAVIPSSVALQLNEIDPYGGWEAKITSGILSSSTVYHNKKTGKQQSAPPEGFARAQSGEGQVVGYFLPSVRAEGKIEIFAPANYAQSKKHDIVHRGCYQNFPEYAPFWSQAVNVFLQEFQLINPKIAELKRVLETAPEEKQRIQWEISKLEKELAEMKAREKEMQAKSDSMLSRVGKSHIKRDWQQTRVGSGFPAGEDYRSMFVEKNLDFESFACDAVNCLEDLKYPDATAAFVTEVMVPLFTCAVSYIKGLIDSRVALLRDEYGSELPEDGRDTIVKLFWHSTLQTKLFHEVMKMDQHAVMQMMLGLGGTVVKLYHEMVRQAGLNLIANDENAIKLDKLLKFLLELQVIAVLSDPPCFLQPNPGAFVSYKESYCQEILSPGTKMYGRIKEGDQVQVVLPGLYFEDATGKYGAVKPVVSCLVRRLVNTGKN